MYKSCSESGILNEMLNRMLSGMLDEMLSEMPVEMLNRMLHRMLSRMLSGIWNCEADKGLLKDSENVMTLVIGKQISGLMQGCSKQLGSLLRPEELLDLRHSGSSH